MSTKIMTEEFISYIWQNGLIKTRFFSTKMGKDIELLHLGSLNRDAGPDFCNALIQIDTIRFCGSVELHLSSSDWYKHGHHKDAMYNNVVLSVVVNDDMPIYTESNRMVDTVELKGLEKLFSEYTILKSSNDSFKCGNSIIDSDKEWIRIYLYRLYIERLERKFHEIREVLSYVDNDWLELFYLLLLRYWGGRVNAEPLQRLGRNIPLHILLKHQNDPFQLRAMLLGGAGLLDGIVDKREKAMQAEWRFLSHKYNLDVVGQEQWKKMRMRPVSFPKARLEQFADFIPQIPILIAYLMSINEVKAVSAFLNLFVEQQSILVKRSKISIGKHQRNTIAINVVVPFLFAYGKECGEERYCEKALDWITELPNENNRITRYWRDLGLKIENAMDSQALIQLSTGYCDNHRCLGCAIGHRIFKSKME